MASNLNVYFFLNYIFDICHFCQVPQEVPSRADHRRVHHERLGLQAGGQPADEEGQTGQAAETRRVLGFPV